MVRKTEEELERVQIDLKEDNIEYLEERNPKLKRFDDLEWYDELGRVIDKIIEDNKGVNISERLEELNRKINERDEYNKHDKIASEMFLRGIPAAIEECDLQELTETICESLFWVMGKDKDVTLGALELVGNIAGVWRQCPIEK